MSNDSQRRPGAVPATIEIPFDARRVLRFVVILAVSCEALFLILDYQFNYGGTNLIGALRRLTNLGREDSLGAWFATSQTLMIALTLWLIYLCTKHAAGAAQPPWLRRGWLLIAAFFSYMVVDDGSQIHERMGTLFSELNPRGADVDPTWATRLLEFFPSYYWQLLFLPIFGAMGLFIVVFLWRVLDRRATILAALAISCFIVAVGMDFVEGLGRDHPFNLYTILSERFDMAQFTEYRFDKSPYDTLRHFSKAIEETTEMFGNTLLWVVFLRHLTHVARDLRVRFVQR